MRTELDAARTAASSLEASKTALAVELQEQKDFVSRLEGKLQDQKQLTETQAESSAEAKAALEVKLQEAQRTETAIKSELEAAQNKLQAAEDRVSSLALELAAAQDRFCCSAVCSLLLSIDGLGSSCHCDWNLDFGFCMILLIVQETLGSCQSSKTAMEAAA